VKASHLVKDITDIISNKGDFEVGFIYDGRINPIDSASHLEYGLDKENHMIILNKSGHKNGEKNKG